MSSWWAKNGTRDPKGGRDGGPKIKRQNYYRKTRQNITKLNKLEHRMT